MDSRFVELTTMTKLYGRMPFEPSPPGAMMPGPLGPTQPNPAAVEAAPAGSPKKDNEEVENLIAVERTFWHSFTVLFQAARFLQERQRQRTDGVVEEPGEHQLPRFLPLPPASSSMIARNRSRSFFENFLERTRLKRSGVNIGKHLRGYVLV